MAPTLESRHGLDRAEAEADQVAGGSDQAVPTARTEGASGVLDHPQVVLGSERVDVIEPADQPGEVTDHDGSGARRDELGQLVGVDGQCRFLDIAEDDVRSGGTDCLVSGDVGEGGGDHLGAEFRAGEDAGAVERRGTTVRRHQPAVVVQFEEVGEGLLELQAQRAESEVTVGQGPVGGVPNLGAEMREPHGQGLRLHGVLGMIHGSSSCCCWHGA
jgi:hypothetical protein